MKSNYQRVVEKLGKRRVKVAEPIAKYTTFGIGGPADLFYEAKTREELVRAVRLAQKLNISFFILGAGSNILVADEGLRGFVIAVCNTKFKIQKEDSKFKIIAGAGMKLTELVGVAADRGLTGLEFAAGIPGTVGGAVRGNAGAWQQSIGDFVSSVKIIDESGEFKSLKKEECRFSYRDSRFKRSNEIILEVNFCLRKGDRKLIKKKIDEYISERSGQPKEASAGCVFVNPKPQPAGYLIDQCGLKGKKIGDAQISPKHANFIINLGKATADDVLQLIKIAKEEVKKKFGIELKEEICLVGFSAEKI